MMAIVISIVLVLVLDIIVSILRLLSTQPVDFSVLLVTLVYSILDAVMVLPAVLIWAAKRVSKRIKTASEHELEINAGEDKSYSSRSLCIQFGYCYFLYR